MILARLLKALRGRKRWLNLKRKYSIEKNAIYVIMMPDDDREFNELALRHVDNFLNYRKGHSVVILTTDEWVATNAQQFSKRIAATEFITQRDCCYLIHCYYCDFFDESFIMLSLQSYYGERLALAENVNGITKEDLSCLGLYVIRNWTRSEAMDG